MKKLFICAFSLVFCNILIAQKQIKDAKQISINDFNFESVTNPAFVLLDETPTAINSPENIKDLAIYLSNGFSNNNIALEINPYWVFGSFKQDHSYKEYRGIKQKNRGYVIDPFKAAETNTTLSAAYLEKQIEGLPTKNKVAAIGVRSTVFQFYGKKRTKKIVDPIIALGKGFEDAAIDKFEKFIKVSGSTKPNDKKCEDQSTALDEYVGFVNAFFQKYPQYASQFENQTQIAEDFLEQSCNKLMPFYLNPKQIKPVLRVDAALGYSVLFKEPEISTSTLERFGGWLTVDAAIKFKSENDKNYLHFLAIVKYVEDEFNINNNGEFFKDNFWDYGVKTELELNRFKISYEYLKRTGINDDRYRSVGNLAYQINETLTLTGGFGKDFPVDNNLVTIIGINWGLKRKSNSNFTN